MEMNKYINFNRLLALNYKKIGLTDDEFILLSITNELISSGTTFVNPNDLSLLCCFSTAKCDVVFSGLIAKKLISNEFDNSNKMYTSLSGVTNKLLSSIKENVDSKESSSIAGFMEVFFNRPLSPLEYDVIQTWINKKYDIKLIKAACELASMSGNKSIRYIDTIIFEENKKQELGAEEYQKREQETIELSKVDWLNK